MTRIEKGETAEYGKEYPHRPEELTKAIVTSKLKGIRSKYRQAVDSGRRSGHGRVVMIFYELCKEIWGGSPATEQIGTGLESGDLETTTDITEPLEPDVADEGNEVERSQEESTVERVQEEYIVQEVSTPQNQSTDVEDLPGPSTAQAQVQDSTRARKLLDDKLSNYKQKNLRKRLPASDFAAEEREFKKKVLQQMEGMDKAFEENMAKLSGNMDKLSGALISCFGMLKDALDKPQQGHQVPPHHPYQPYQPYAAPPTSLLSPPFGQSRPGTPSDSNRSRQPPFGPSQPETPEYDKSRYEF